MYCNNCGKNNPKASKFCQHCGIKFHENSVLEAKSLTELTSEVQYINQDTPPYPYVISIWKLIIMDIFTIRFYSIYWFYKQWKSFDNENNLKHSSFALFIYALFAPLSSYSLFKNISNSVKRVNNGKGLEAGALAILNFILPVFYLGFIPLIFVQNKINLYWENKYGNKLVRSNFGLWNWIIVITVSLIVLYAVANPSNNSSTSNINSSSYYFATPTPDAIALENTYGNNFMDNCNSGGKLYAYCLCTLTYLRNNYTLAQRVQLDLDYEKTKQLPQAMYDAIKFCVPSNTNSGY